jgi:hypothetical protein
VVISPVDQVSLILYLGTFQFQTIQALVSLLRLTAISRKLIIPMLETVSKFDTITKDGIDSH